MVKTIVIIGGTRTAALNRLKRIVPNDGIVHNDFTDEVTLDSHRIIAFGGERENICWLQDLGANRITEIIMVGDGISEEMRRYVQYVRSANRK